MKAIVKASDFNKRITFLRKRKDTKDEDGYPLPPDKVWEAIIKVWAASKTVKGREFYQAATVQSDRNTRFIVRYSRELEEILDNKMRVQYRNRIFEIESIINDDEANITFTIMTKEVM